MKKYILILCCALIAINAFCQVQYNNMAANMGIQHNYVGLLGGGVSFVDFNNDGRDDITIATGGIKIYISRIMEVPTVYTETTGLLFLMTLQK